MQSRFDGVDSGGDAAFVIRSVRAGPHQNKAYGGEDPKATDCFSDETYCRFWKVSVELGVMEDWP